MKQGIWGKNEILFSGKVKSFKAMIEYLFKENFNDYFPTQFQECNHNGDSSYSLEKL